MPSSNLFPSVLVNIFCSICLGYHFRVKLFIIRGYPYYVIRVHKDEKGKIEYKAEYCSGKTLQSEYGGGGSQIATPKKSDRSMETDDVWDDIDNWIG